MDQFSKTASYQNSIKMKQFNEIGFVIKKLFPKKKSASSMISLENSTKHLKKN